MCRKGAWAELTVCVPSMGEFRRKAHGLKMQKRAGTLSFHKRSLLFLFIIQFYWKLLLHHFFHAFLHTCDASIRFPTAKTYVPVFNKFPVVFPNAKIKKTIKTHAIIALMVERIFISLLFSILNFISFFIYNNIDL